MNEFFEFLFRFLTLWNFVYLILAYISYSLLKYFFNFFFPREKTLPEEYPFHHTYELIKYNDAVLETCDRYFNDALKRTGKTSFVINVFGLPPLVMTNEVENVTYILKTNYTNFGKSGEVFKTKFQGLLGDGIFNSDGHQWFAHRKTSAHLFKLEKFKNHILDVFNDDLNQLINLIKQENGQKFDIHDFLHKFTLESISRIAFGVELGCISKKKVEFASDFDFCTMAINNSMINPLWRLNRYLSLEGWKYFMALHRLNKYAYKIIRDRRKLIESNRSENDGDVKKYDLLSLYLIKDNFKNDGGSAIEGSSDFSDTFIEPSDKNLRDVILNMLIAGRDTTAQALSWAFYRLCIHPEVQSKAREEILCVLKESYANKPSQVSTQQSELDRLIAQEGSGSISYQALQKMKYLEAFCMEVLRLHPSVPKEGKSVLKDDILPDGTKVKKGDIISFQSWSMGRDVRLWGENASEFDPTRFLNKPKPSPFIFTAFQAGPRTCLGQNFAMLEMKCTLARLLSFFEFKLEQDPSSVRYANSLTLPIKDGLAVSAKYLH